MNQKLILLAQRLRYELDNLEKVIRDAESGWQKFLASSDSLYLSVVALNLHGFYTGVEELLRKIAFALRERMPQGEKWHHALLQQMATAVSGLRPAVISQNSHDTLDEYRKFRHLVRNTYPFRLDPDKIQPLVASAPNILTLLRSDLLAFATFLENQARDHTGEEIS